MSYNYLIYGIPLIAEIELPDLIKNENAVDGNPIYVTIGPVPKTLVGEVAVVKPFSMYNENEFRYFMPEVATYYVCDGNKVIIEPITDDWEAIRLYFYSNCIAAALFQRNIIPFHVSGVFINPQQVLLFAAPSRTGKSTTAVMLQEKEYPLFTDDTAILTVENGKCYARASYPMTRLWQQTIQQQRVFDESGKRSLRSNIELSKYGFLFHEKFITSRVEVAGIVFLDQAGTEIVIESLTAKNALLKLGDNIYRKQWLAGMKKDLVKFKALTTVLQVVPTWQATRPKGVPTFQQFALEIEREIITAITESLKTSA